MTRNLSAAAIARMGMKGEQVRPHTRSLQQALTEKRRPVQALQRMLSYTKTPNTQVRISVVYGLRNANVFSKNIDFICKDLFNAGRDPTPLVCSGLSSKAWQSLAFLFLLQVRRCVMETLGVLGKRANNMVPYLSGKSLLR